MRIPHTPPPLDDLLVAALRDNQLLPILSALPTGLQDSRYYHWDELRFRKPPAELTHAQWWTGVKLQRRAGRREIPLYDVMGKSFGFVVPDLVDELLHQIDRDGGTLIQLPEDIANKSERDRYLIRSLMEEAITSSQLEGAATTREVAKKMLTEGRAPRDRSEVMILNNFQTMQRIMEVKKEPLTPALVLDIHHRVSNGALDTADAAGRLRRPEESIDISNEMTGQVFHVPPPAESLPERLETMCRFANGAVPGYFIHPVLRAIILHFWLAYDHPFVDGNGRTARALFYWQMLHQGYWTFEFISISQILRQAPVKYGTAFLHTETDGNDLTYFIIHQAEVIRRALGELHDYVARKSRETRKSMAYLQNQTNLNHRQQAILAHALRHSNHSYSVAGHQNRQGIAYATARADLLGLAEKGLLDQRKSGKTFVFVAPPDLEARLSGN